MRILVVDQDPSSLQRAISQLGNLGFDATGTLDEAEALGVFSDHDLLVLAGDLDDEIKANLVSTFKGPIAAPRGPRDLLKTVRHHILQGQKPRLIALAGSTRIGSYNQQLLGCAIDHAINLGAEVTVANLKHYGIPLFDQDLETEHGLPEAVRDLQALLFSRHGILVASPEYNGSISPLLKNTLDWISRSTGDAPGLACYANQVVTLLSASPGSRGGLRGLSHLRDIMSNLGCVVLPSVVAVGRAQEAFDEAGHLKRPARLHSAVEQMVGSISRLYA